MKAIVSLQAYIKLRFDVIIRNSGLIFPSNFRQSCQNLCGWRKLSSGWKLSYPVTVHHFGIRPDGSRGVVLGVVSRLPPGRPRNRSWISERGKGFLMFKRARPVLWSAQPFTQLVTVELCPGLKRPRRKGNYSHPALSTSTPNMPSPHAQGQLYCYSLGWSEKKRCAPQQILSNRGNTAEGMSTSLIPELRSDANHCYSFVQLAYTYF
jgi:hypothetical protein